MTASFLRPEERPQHRASSPFDAYKASGPMLKGRGDIPYTPETAHLFLADTPTAKSVGTDIPFNLIRLRYKRQKA